MNQYLVYFAIGIGLLLVALVVPGLKVLAEAILKLLLEVFVEIFKRKGMFIVWLVKTLAGDHMRLIQHATQDRDTLDPTEKIRREAEGYEEEPREPFGKRLTTHCTALLDDVKRQFKPSGKKAAKAS